MCKVKTENSILVYQETIKNCDVFSYVGNANVGHCDDDYMLHV
jgi:hypothetical protein